MVKNTRMIEYFENYLVASMLQFSSIWNFKHCLCLCKGKKMKILVVSLISSWDFCICIEMQSISVFLHKRGNLLYCENSKHSRHFLESEWKVHVALIRLLKELGVLNVQNCKQVKVLFAGREWIKQHKVRHLVARKVHEQENWPVI